MATTTPKLPAAIRDIQGLRNVDPNLRGVLQAMKEDIEYMYGVNNKRPNAAIFTNQYNEDLADIIAGNSTDPFKTIIADYSIVGDDHTIFIDSTSGAITAKLPRASSNKGKLFVIMKTSTDSNITRADVTNDGLINGYEGVILTVKSSITVRSDGTIWHIVSSTKDVDTIAFEEFLTFSDDELFLFSDGTQFITHVVGN